MAGSDTVPNYQCAETLTEMNTL